MAPIRTSKPAAFVCSCHGVQWVVVHVVCLCSFMCFSFLVLYISVGYPDWMVSHNLGSIIAYCSVWDKAPSWRSYFDGEILMVHLLLIVLIGSQSTFFVSSYKYYSKIRYNTPTQKYQVHGENSKQQHMFQIAYVRGCLLQTYIQFWTSWKVNIQNY